MKAFNLGLVLSSFCVLAAGCSHTADTLYPPNDTLKAANANANAEERNHHFAKVAKIDFNRGGTKLARSEREELDSVVQEARASGKIQEIKILAWADKDYAVGGRKASKAEINLADARANAIRNYIRDALKVSAIDTHNMAEQPSAMGRVFKTDDYELKTGRYDKNGMPFKPMASPQKAVVLIEMEEYQ